MKIKPLSTIINSLNDKGINNFQISKETGIAFSCIYKISRGEQASLPYEKGKLIEHLDNKTKGRK